MKKMMKIMMVVLTLGTLVSCGAEEKKVEEKAIEINEEQIGRKADEVIQAYVKNDFENLYNMESSKLKEQLTVEKLKEVKNIVNEEFGNVKSIKERKFAQKDGIILCVSLTEFEKGTGQIQTSFNKDLQLEGFAIIK